MARQNSDGAGLVVSSRNRFSDFIFMFIIFLVSLLFLFPFYWMLITSFKLSYVSLQIPPELFPLKPTLINFQQLFSQPALRWLLNSFIIAAGTALLVCLTSAMAGYSLSKKEYPLRNAIFWLFVAVMTLPKQVLMVPLFILMRDFGWFDSYQGLILPAVGWPFGVFLMKQFTQTVPNEILEAADIDGCSEWQKFSKIVLPLVKPGIGALAIFTFMSAWNDYFWQLIMIKSRSMQTIQIGVQTMQLEFSKNYGLIMAGAIFASLPMIAIFLLFQKYFTQGITLGAVKG